MFKLGLTPTKKIVFLSVMFLQATVVNNTAPKPSGKKTAIVIMAGIFGGIAGYYGTTQKITKSYSGSGNRTPRHLSIDSVAPLFGGIAGALLAAIIADHYYDVATGIPHSPSSRTDQEFPNFTNNDHKPHTSYSAEKSDTKISDIIGIDPVIAEIKDVMDQIQNPGKYKKFGVKFPKGILLVGPPGTGKTMIAKALANESNASFLYASAAAFHNEYVGSGPKNIKELFTQARQNKGFTIIFIDEIDALGNRDKLGGTHDHTRQTINQFLTELDGFNELNNVCVLAATNKINDVDEALKRPGRFDRIIEVPLPNAQGRLQLIKHLSRTKPHVNISEAYVQKLAEKTEGFGAGDIKNIFNMAALEAARTNATAVNEKLIDTALQKVLIERKKKPLMEA